MENISCGCFFTRIVAVSLLALQKIKVSLAVRVVFVKYLADYTVKLLF